MLENKIEVFLKDKMCIDVKNLYEKISSFSSSEQCVIYNFIKKCITQINSMQNKINANILDFHEHPIVKEITNFYNNLIDNIKEDEAKIVLDSIRQAFSHFAVGGLLQLYERQENEVWYPKILLTEVLIPNDISLLPDYVEIYRGCDISEFNLKEFNQAWTTKQNIASDFAFKHYSNQKWFKFENRAILKATISKNNIFYAKNSGEYEVVVDSGKLINVEIFKMNPIISVVMSVYNAEKYLDEAIQSILNQTYKDFEFIIINDGSTDKSLEIIEKYKYQDTRIVLISRENRGLIASLNEGIELAKGKYIARMDADDISLPNRFEEQLKIMENDKEIVVCGSWINVFGENRKEKISKYFQYDKEIKANLIMSCCFAHPSVMMRRDAFVDNNIWYDENFKNAEDYHLWTQLARVGKFYNIPKVLLNYRFLETSITRVAEKEVEKRYQVVKNIFQEALNILDINLSEDEKKLHFIISDNIRTNANKVLLSDLKNYFKKILKANDKLKKVDSIALNKVLGRRWLYNFICHKEFKAIFSKYFWYGVASVIGRKS